jgi:hypothetical protein
MEDTEYSVQQWRDHWMVHKWTGGRIPEVSYKVTEHKGRLTCGCPSGRYRNYCKHTSMVREYQRAEREGKLGEAGIFFIRG